MDNHPRILYLLKLIATRRSSRLHPWILAGIILLYLVTFPILKSPILVAVPAAIAGWFYYRRGGIIGSFFALLINMFLTKLFFHELSFEYLLQLSNGVLIGHIFVLASSFSTGYLREEIEIFYRIEQKLRSRDRHITLVNIATRDILEMKNSEGVYFQLLAHLTNLFVADYAYLTHWDAGFQQVSLVAATDSTEHPFPIRVLASDEAAVTLSVLDSRHALFIEDVQSSSSMVNPVEFQKHHLSAKSAIVFPLATREYKFGAVILVFDSTQNSNREDISYLELASVQITLALNSILQESRIEKQLRETQALSSIERALSESEKIGLDAVLQLIVNSARELIPNATHAVLHLLDEKREVLVPREATELADRSKPNLNMRMGEGVAGQVIAFGETVAIADIWADPRFLHQTQPVSYRSLIVAPVQINDRRLGTISVHREEAGRFHPDEIALLASLGVQAAIAIENVHLLESTQQALKETNALYRINRELLATLDPQELMQDVVELLQQSFGYAYVQIYVADPQNGDFIMRAGSGEIGRQLKEQGYRLQAGEGIVGYTAETRAPFFTNNVDEVVSYVRTPLLPDVKSQLAVPVKIGERILGLLDIQQVPPAQLTQRDVQMVSVAADQLALALQKANLYADLQASLQTEKAIRNQLLLNDRLATMGRLLASVSHELNNPLQAIQNALFLLREEQGISSQGRQDLDIVLSESERMAALIARLRATYRPIQAEDFHQMQLNDVIEDVYALIATHLRHYEISFEFFPDPYLPVIPALPDQIRQVVLNLLMNAVEAMPDGGRLTVSTELQVDNAEVLLRVSDSGMGIDPTIMQNIFEAFVTNKERGTGLGLTIVYDIVNRHRGRIQAWNNPECGATFSVWLPVGAGEGR